MKNNLLLLTSAFLITLCWLAACQTDDQNNGIDIKPDLPAQPFDYSLQVPEHFGQQNMVITIDDLTGDTIISFFHGFGFGFNPANPAITNPGATLGRVLFYDPQLSLNNSVACGSCHHQTLAFSDGLASSQGFAGNMTPRNSMAILNAGFNQNLFWDSRENSVKSLVTRPIQNHIEMGVEEMRRLEIKLAKVDYYPALFQAAFGDQQITEERIASALSQFVCAITTTNSRFDQEVVNNFSGFSALEKTGRDLFFSTRTNCSRCHAEPNFAAPDFVGGEYGSSSGTFIDSTNGTIVGGGENLKGGANNGLDQRYADPGIGNDKSGSRACATSPSPRPICTMGGSLRWTQ